MSKFEKLRELHVKQDRAIQDYWTRLATAAGQIANAFEAYLELPERTYKDLTKKTDVRYVQLGKWDGRNFEESHSLGLEGVKGRLRFGIKFTIDSDINAYPKKNIVVPMDIGTTGDPNGPLEVMVNAGAANEKTLIVQDGFEAVAEAIYKLIEESLSKWA